MLPVIWVIQFPGDQDQPEEELIKTDVRWGKVAGIWVEAGQSRLRQVARARGRILETVTETLTTGARSKH